MVLVAPGEFFGSDDVVEASNVDDNATNLLIDTTPAQYVERDISAVAIAKFAQNVDRAFIGHPGGTPERTQRLSVELNGELTGFVVGHPTDTKPGSELAERISEPTQVDESTFGNAVDVTGRAERAVRTGTQTAHQHVLDVVLIQNGEDSPRVERSLSHRARQPPAVR